MTNTKKESVVNNTFEVLKKCLEAREWKYSPDDSDLVVRFGIGGKDFSQSFLIRLEADKEQFYILNFLPFKIPENMLDKAMEACCLINSTLISGAFTVVRESYEIAYRNCSSYRGMTVAPKVFDEIIDYSAWLMDEYSFKLMALTRGYIGVNDILKNLDETAA